MIEQKIHISKSDSEKIEKKFEESKIIFLKLSNSKIYRSIVIFIIFITLVIINYVWYKFLPNLLTESAFYFVGLAIIIYSFNKSCQFLFFVYYYKTLIKKLQDYLNNRKIEPTKFVEIFDTFLQMLSAHTMKGSKQKYGLLINYRGIRTRTLKNIDIFCDVTSTYLSEEDKNDIYSKTINIIIQFFADFSDHLKKGYFKESYVNIFLLNELIKKYNKELSKLNEEFYKISKEEISNYYNTKFERKEIFLRNIIYFILYATVFFSLNYILRILFE